MKKSDSIFTKFKDGLIMLQIKNKMRFDNSALSKPVMLDAPKHGKTPLWTIPAIFLLMMGLFGFAYWNNNTQKIQSLQQLETEQASSKILSNKIKNLEDYATSLEEEILQGERDLETMTKKKDAALDKVGSDIKAKDVVISEKNTEIKRLLGVQKEFEAHVVEIETELKSIKENFELYKKELLKDEVVTPTLVPPSVIPPVKP